MLSTVRELVGAEILVIDQDERVTKGITKLLSAASLHVTTVSDLAAALDLIDKRFFSVVVVDLDTPTPNAGVQTTIAVKERSPTSMVVALTPRKSYADAVAAIRAGAMDVILKDPESVGYLRERVIEAAGRSVDKREVNSVLADVRESHEEFLKRFMDAERRALDLSDRLAGRDPQKGSSGEMVRVLMVEPTDQLGAALRGSNPRGFEFETVPTGGQALDHCTSQRFQIVMVAEDLPDLPGSMVVRSIKTQNPEMVAITFRPPPGGRVRHRREHPHHPGGQAARRSGAAARPARRAGRGVSRQGARAPLCAGVPRAPLRLLAQVRRAEIEDRPRAHRRVSCSTGLHLSTFLQRERGLLQL